MELEYWAYASMYLSSYFPRCDSCRSIEDGVTDNVLEACQYVVHCWYSVLGKGKLADLFRDFKDLIVNLISFPEIITSIISWSLFTQKTNNPLIA